MNQVQKRRVAVIIAVILLLLLGRRLFHGNKEPAAGENDETIVLENTTGDHTLMEDGKYQATGQGYGGPITVELTVTDGYMKRIKIKEHHEDPGVAGTALERVPKEMVRKQSVNVDAVAGATQTVQGIQEAVSTCIRQAGGE